MVVVKDKSRAMQFKNAAYLAMSRELVRYKHIGRIAAPVR